MQLSWHEWLRSTYLDQTSSKLYTIESPSINKVNEAVKRLKSRPPVIDSTVMDDGFHFYMEIDNLVVISKFGQDSLLDIVLFELSPYIHNQVWGCK